MPRHFIIVLSAALLGAGCGGGGRAADADGDVDADVEATDADFEADAEEPGDAGPTPPPELSYCEGRALLYELPEDPAQRGPWIVGARTLEVAGLTVEVWYPAAWRSEEGQEPRVYDLREHLPDGGEGVEPSEDIMQPCDCYGDLPLDTDHGPYAVILFVHGFSGFRGQSLEFMVHWASRGFVVLSADHPSIGLRTFLEDGILGLAFNMLLTGELTTMLGACDLDVAGGQTDEALAILEELQHPSGSLEFLAGHVDMGRVGASGHSAGGAAVRPLGAYPGVQVVAPMAMGGVCAAEHVRSALVIGAMEDGIAAYRMQRDGYADSPTPKRLLGLANAGHMAFTSFCPLGEGSGGILGAAQAAGVEFDPLFLSVIEPLSSDGCGAEALAPEVGWEVTSYATAAAFEEILLCQPERADDLSRIWRLYPDAVGEFLEAH